MPRSPDRQMSLVWKAWPCKSHMVCVSTSPRSLHARHLLRFCTDFLDFQGHWVDFALARLCGFDTVHAAVIHLTLLVQPESPCDLTCVALVLLLHFQGCAPYRGGTAFLFLPNEENHCVPKREPPRPCSPANCPSWISMLFVKPYTRFVPIRTRSNQVIVRKRARGLRIYTRILLIR